MSILKSEVPEEGKETKFKLMKNVEKNVAAVEVGDWTSYYTMIFYRDGTSKRLDNKTLEY